MHSADDNVRGSLRYWPQHLAALMSCSAAVRELARTRLVGQEPIVKFLIVNSNDDAREVFAQMLHECVRQTYLHDGLENGHNTLAVVMQFAVQATRNSCTDWHCYRFPQSFSMLAVAQTPKD